MYVENKEMYHFHNNKVYNDLWQVGNEIIVDENFTASFARMVYEFDTAVNTKNGNRVSFNNIIDNYLTKDLDKETYINLLKEASDIIKFTVIFMRESVLEYVRKEKYPQLPSRLKSIWLCDEKGIEFWKSMLSFDGANLDLFKVCVTGELFKSNDAFLPQDSTNFTSHIIAANKYWNPVYTDDIKEEENEYLFQGKLKILRKES